MLNDHFLYAGQISHRIEEGMDVSRQTASSRLNEVGLKAKFLGIKSLNINKNQASLFASTHECVLCFEKDYNNIHFGNESYCISQ